MTKLRTRAAFRLCAFGRRSAWQRCRGFASYFRRRACDNPALAMEQICRGGRGDTMARMIWALALCGIAAATMPVAGQGIYEVAPTDDAPLQATPAPPAPSDAPVTRPESLPLDNVSQDAAAAEAKPAENAQGRFTFS